MYVKLWRGRTPAEEAASFGDALDRTWIREIIARSDNLGALSLYRIDDDEAEFIVITMWSRPVPELDDLGPGGMVLDTHIELGDNYEFFVRGDVALGVGMLE